MINYEEWIALARTATTAIAPNHIFVLKDLFDGIGWARLERGEKLELGRQFKYAVIQNAIPSVKCYGKAQNNSTRYIKTE